MLAISRQDLRVGIIKSPDERIIPPPVRGLWEAAAKAGSPGPASFLVASEAAWSQKTQKDKTRNLPCPVGAVRAGGHIPVADWK